MRFHESYLSLIKSDVKLKIVQFLLHHEASMSEREIASVVGVSHMSVNRVMQDLAQANLVHYVTVGKAHLWKVNRKSFAFKALVKFLDKVKEVPDPLAELQQIILKRLPKSLVQRVVLFGSVAKNKEKADSDIDVFVLVKNAQDQEKLGSSIEKLSGECLDVFGNRLSPYILTEKRFGDFFHGAAGIHTFFVDQFVRGVTRPRFRSLRQFALHKCQ